MSGTVLHPSSTLGVVLLFLRVTEDRVVEDIGRSLTSMDTELERDPVYAPDL